MSIIQDLQTISNDRAMLLDEKLENLLRIGTEILRLETGIVSNIRGDQYSVQSVVTPGDSIPEDAKFSLCDTYCADVASAGTVVAYHNIDIQPGASHPCFEKYTLKSYLAAPIHVFGEFYGTVNFSSLSPREEAFGALETDYLLLLASWIGNELERQQALSNLKAQKVVLEERNSLLNQITNLAGVGTWELNVDSGSIVWSGALKRMLHVHSERVLKPDEIVNFIVSEEQRKSYVNQFQEMIKTGEDFAYEVEVKTDAGEPRWLESRAHPIMENGRCVKVIGATVDITQMQIDKAVLRHKSELAESALKARSDFLANMSHEIRTPMNAIIGFSDLMLGEALREEQKSHLTTINRSARSLLHLLNDILDSAKLDKGKLDLDYRDFLIREELDLVISTFWLEAKRKKVGLVLNVDDSVANGYRGVPERMRQVLNNLIGNAVKFTHDGEVTINVKSDEKFVYFDVTDTGIGMTQEQVGRVFDPFSQADASMSRKYGGTGLGTTISKQLVELMGGNICATSEKGKGTTFTFRLPLEVVEIDDYVSSELSSKAARIETSLTVLVVDDVQQNLELLSLLLKRAGHSVETATDGQVALDKMRAKSFDVVLMDLQMPKLDGLEAAKQRREFEKENSLPPTPIIALTASVLVQDKHAAQQAGMEGFANKPVDFPQLMDEIARVLNIDTLQVDSVPDTLEVNAPASTLKVDKNVLDLKKAVDLWGSEEAVLYKAVATLSHSLKGTSGNLCLTTFYHTTREIEAQALKSEVNIEDVNRLRDALERIELMLSESPLYAENAINESIDNALLLSHLEAMLDSVEQNMVDEEELTFLREVGCSSHKEQITQILLDIDDFEFELAHERISTLIKELK